MEINGKTEKEVVIAEVSGRLDAVSAPDFDKWVSSQPGLKKLVVDVSKLEYISSAGLRSILASAKRTKAAGGGIAVIGLAGTVDEVFKMSGFLTIIPAFASIDEAVASFG